MKKTAKNIGIEVKPPKEKCEDRKCPFHGTTKLRGRTFVGTLISKDAHRSAIVEWSYKISVPKYERKETRRTKVHVHNPPCINANEGDIVKIMETRPLSKTKNFIVVENLGKEKGFEEKLEAKEEAKEIIEKKERKQEEEPQEEPSEKEKPVEEEKETKEKEE